MPSPSPAPVEYLIGLNNQPRGPFSLEDLALLARSGVVTARTRVMAQGWEDWVAASDVPELAALLAVVPAQPAVPAADNEASARALQQIAARVEKLQAGVLALAKDLELRTETLKDGQKLSVQAVANGQGAIQAALEEFRKAEGARKDTLSQQLAELELRLAKSIRDQSVAAASETEAKLRALTQAVALVPDSARQAQAELQKEIAALHGRLDQDAARQKALDAAVTEGLARMAEASGRETTRVAEAVEAIRTELATVQARAEQSASAVLARMEEFRKEAEASAQARQEAEAARAGEALQALESKLSTQITSLESAQKEVLVQATAASTEEREALAGWLGALEESMARIRKDAEVQRLDNAARTEVLERRLVEFEQASNQRADVFLQHISGWEAAWAERIKPVVEEIQATSGRLDAQFSRLGQSAEAQAEALTSLRASLEATQTRLQTAWDQAAVRAEEDRAATENRLKELEDNALERHAILLAAADESRAGADRIIRHVEETFTLAREDTQTLRAQFPALEDRLVQLREETARLLAGAREAGVEAVRESAAQTAEALRETQVRLAARMEELHDTARTEAETAARRLQERADQLAQEASGLEQLVKEELAARSGEISATLNAKLGELDENFRAQETRSAGLAAAVEAVRAALAAAQDEQRQALADGFASAAKSADSRTERAETALQRHFQKLQDDVRGLSADVLRLAEEQSVLLRDSLAKSGFDAAARAEASAQLLRELLGAQEDRTRALLESQAGLVVQAAEDLTARQEHLSQSVANLGAWSETLHDQIDAAQTALADAVTALRTSLEHAGRQQAGELQAALTQTAATLAASLQATGEDARAAAAQISKQIHQDTAAATKTLQRQIEDTAAEWRARSTEEKSARDQAASLQTAALAELKESLAGWSTEARKRLEGEGRAREKTAAALAGTVRDLQASLQQALHDADAAASGRIQAVQQEVTAALARHQDAVRAELEGLQSLVKEEMTAGWAKRWTLLATDLASMRDAAVQRQEALGKELAALEARLPAAAASQARPQLDALAQRLAQIEQALAAQETRIEAARTASENEIALQFGMQQRLFDQILGTLKKDVGEGFLTRIQTLQTDVERLRQEAPETREILARSIHEAVAKLPEHLAESYRVTNNALQKQIAELAQEIGAATQMVEKSAQTLTKAGAEHRASLEESSEAARQQGAAALRDARDQVQVFYNNLLEQLKNWQAEQSKVINLAASLVAEARGIAPDGPNAKGPASAHKEETPRPSGKGPAASA